MTIIFILGSWQFAAGVVTLGSVYLVFHYVDMTRHPMEQIRAQLEDLQKAGAAIERVQDLLDTKSRLHREGDRTVEGGALRVQFDDVTFSYEDEKGDETVLDAVSFDYLPRAGSSACWAGPEAASRPLPD